MRYPRWLWVLFACLAKSELVGYVSVSRDWNGCAIIDDIAVARPYRRHGIAGELLDHAVMWTRAVGLGAVRLETQSRAEPDLIESFWLCKSVLV
ncbi:GNAT family N-acetyltransferase [Sinorhizobium medicae]|nr:GNAT family N-acetyltransferase [Sinorhizobium medicae]